MPEWFFEHGIGEDRAIFVERGQVLAARVDWPGNLRAGSIVDAKLARKTTGTKRGLGLLGDETEVLIDRLPSEITEGQSLRIEITRCAIAERGRYKRSQGRPAPSGAQTGDGPDLITQLRASAFKVTVCRPGDGIFSDYGWDDVVEEALSGAIAFAGGSLQVSVTPAMTLIDIDGDLPPARLALAAIPAIAETVGKLDLSGSVGIDFPTIADRKDRQAVDEALANALSNWHGERTAMNGFGFVQLISRLQRPSIAALYQRFPARVAALSMARHAEGIAQAGRILLTAHPALRPALPDGFIEELTKRTGRQVVWNWDETVALDAPYAQALSA